MAAYHGKNRKRSTEKRICRPYRSDERCDRTQSRRQRVRSDLNIDRVWPLVWLLCSQKEDSGTNVRDYGQLDIGDTQIRI